jgi:uncharacterized membrane protein
MWFVVGLLFGVGLLLALAVWLRSRKILVTWYEWLIGILGLALLLFAIQNSLASVAELEPVAPYMFLLVFGVPAVVLIAVAFLLPWFRYRKVTNQSDSE